MATTTVTSKQFTLNLRDVFKGLLVAVLTPLVPIISQSLNNGSLTFDWKAIGIAALGGFVAYIVKNFLTPSQIVMENAAPETVQQVKEGTANVTVQSK